MHRKSIFLIILSSIIVFGALSDVAGQIIYISTFDPINARIEELQTRGYLPALSATEKPWIRSDVVDAIRADENRFDDYSRRIAREILSVLEPSQRKPGMSAGLEAGVDVRGLSRERREGYFIRRGRYIDRGFKNEFGTALRVGWWISRDDSWGIDTRLLYDTDGTNYPWYFGRAREARTLVQFDHAYAAFRVGSFDLVFGRQRMIWGPSPRGSLILDDGSPPFDLARASLRLAPFILTWFGSRLDDYYDAAQGALNRRFFAGHRLTLNTEHGWEIGLSEVVIYGGPDRIPELYYGIPVVLYYWEAHNHYKDDNVLWALDFSWTRKGIGRSYLQFVADDIQYQHRGPQKFALQTGIHLVPSRFPEWSALIELNMVDTYVYGQRQRQNAYLNWGSSIARLGSDQYEIFAGLYDDIIPDLRTGIEYTFRGKGRYDAQDFQPGLLPLDTKFPTGTIEGINDFRLTSSYHRKSNFDIRLSIGYQSIYNYRRELKSSVDQFYTMVDISYSLGSGLPFWTKYH